MKAFGILPLALAIGFVFAFTPARRAAADAPASVAPAELDQAKAMRVDAMRQAEALLDRAVKNVATQKSIDEMKTAISEKEAFLKSGVMPSSPEMKQAVNEYTRARDEANNSLLAAYARAVGEYAKQQRYDDAESVLTEMRKFTDLNSPSRTFMRDVDENLTAAAAVPPTGDADPGAARLVAVLRSLDEKSKNTVLTFRWPIRKVTAPSRTSNRVELEVGCPAELDEKRGNWKYESLWVVTLSKSDLQLTKPGDILAVTGNVRIGEEGPATFHFLGVAHRRLPIDGPTYGVFLENATVRIEHAR